MRNFVNVTWNNSAENYDGFQQKNKHFNPNGSAAIHNYTDEALTKKSKKSITESILLAERHMNRLEDMSQALEQEYLSKAIDTETYVYARKTLDKRLEKAFLRVAKDRNWSDNTETEEESLTTPQNRGQKVVLHRVFDGINEENSVLHILVAVYSFYTKLKRICEVIKNVDSN